MSIDIDNSNRQVIPRWMNIGQAFASGNILLTGRRPILVDDDDQLRALCSSWNSSRTLELASDLVGCATVCRKRETPEAIEAANCILEWKHSKDLQREMAIHLLHGPQIESMPASQAPDLLEHARKEIKRIRNLLKDQPNNALRWSDLAYYYTLLSQDRKAREAIVVSLNLTNSTYVLRSAARFFTHTDDPERALSILRAAPQKNEDPLVMATEISIAESFGLDTRLIDRGIKFLTAHEGRRKWLQSELQSTIGTKQIRDGAHKKGKQLVLKSLNGANENVLAQARWLESKNAIVIGEKAAIDVPCSFEADLWLAQKLSDHRMVVERARDWMRFQPFTTKPAVVGSYTASTHLEDHSLAAEIAQEGLLSSPTDPILLNNLAFSLASLGDTEVARSTLAQIKTKNLPEQAQSTMQATRGLIAFKEGDADLGRRLYKESVEHFASTKNKDHEARALLHWAQCEVTLNPLAALELLTRTKSIANSLEKQTEIQRLVGNVIERLSKMDVSERNGTKNAPLIKTSNTN